jgi:hypothetical protein
MAVPRTTSIFGPPDISRETWLAVLRNAGSFESPLWSNNDGREPKVPQPPEAEASAGYDIIVGRGILPSFALAVMGREHSYGTHPNSVLRRSKTRSMSNARSCQTAGMPHELISDAVRGGPYVKYQATPDSFIDFAVRLTKPDYRYVQEGRDTVEEVLGIFTESESEGYIQYACNAMAAYRALNAGSGPPPTPDGGGGTGELRPHIVMRAGHRDAGGGNAKEQEQTGELCYHAAQELRRRNRFDVTVITPGDGRGMYAGDYNAAAREVVALDSRKRVNMYVSWHTEGNSAGDAGRGAFVVVPDWPAAGDVETAGRTRFAPDFMRRLNAATGLPIRTSSEWGVMSERRTGVGLSGYRLGEFAYTAPIKDHCTRVLPEMGSHSSPADLRITDAPGFYPAAAVAFADAVEVFYFGSIGAPAPTPAPVEDKTTFAEVPYAYERGFHAFYTMANQAKHEGTDTGAGFLTMGYPRSPELDISGLELGKYGQMAQAIDTGVMVWNPAQQRPWDVRPASIATALRILAYLAQRGDITRKELDAMGLELVEATVPYIIPKPL